MIYSCAGGGNCNCDKDNQTWIEDSGYLTDKNTLPVTELKFGDTGSSHEKGYYTLKRSQINIYEYMTSKIEPVVVKSNQWKIV